MAQEFAILDEGLDEALVEHLRQLLVSVAQLNTSVLPSYYRDPEKPRRGQLALADGVNWDPLGVGPGSYVVWYNDETESWTAL